MKFKRRCFFIIVILLVVLSSSVYADKMNDETLSSQKLVEALVNEPLVQSENVSRESFVKYVTKLLKLNTSQSTEQIFADVTVDEDFNMYLQAAVANRLINVSDNFRPEDAITFDEAIAIVVRATGYSRLAEIEGGYPGGYRNVAKEAELLENLSLNKNFDTAACYMLLQNMLLADVMELSGNSYKVSDGKTLLEILYNCKMNEGILTANDVSCLGVDGSEIATLNAKIGDDTYTFKEEYKQDIRNYIGYNVRIFYDVEYNEAILMIPYRNEEVEFIEMDIELENNSLVVYKENKMKKYKLDTGYSLIYNGKSEDIINNAMLNPDSGKVMLINNDKDDEYEVIVVESYTYLKAGKVNTINMTIPDGIDGTNSLDLSDNDCIYDIYSPDDNEFIYIKDIPMNSYLAVRKSTDGKFIYIELCQNFVTGKIVSMDEEKLKLDDVEYYYTENFRRRYGNNAIGVKGNFYLGVNGDVISVERNDDSWIYGYLQKVYYGDDGDTIYARIFDQMGLWDTYLLKDRVVIDGKSMKYKSNIEQMYNQLDLNEESIIKFKANEGLITHLDFSDEASQYGESLNVYENNSLTEYNFTTDGYYYTTNSQAFYPNFSVKSSIVFSIPKDKTDRGKYRITSNSIFADKETYIVTPYDVDKYGVATIVLYNNTDGNLNYNMNSSSISHMIVEQSSIAIDEDDEVRTKISGWSNGGFVSYFVDEEVEIKIETERTKLVPGDLIKYHLNSSGLIDNIIVDFDAEKFGKNNGNNTSPYNAGEKNVMQLSGGYVYSVGAETITIMPEGNENSPMWNKIRCISFAPGEKNIVVFNRTTKKLRPGRIEDIKSYSDFGTSGNFVVVRQSYLGGQYVFVYEE